MPPEVALGLMMNLGLANSWKSLPMVQGIGVAFSNKSQIANFTASLMGRSPSIKDAISAHLDQQNERRRTEWPSL